MIESFTISNLASYDAVGIRVFDLNKINFIYGANGCGKTTISNYLTDTTDAKYADCSVTWKDGSPVQTLVYNKAFRDRNFGASDIAGVFTLGQATPAELKEIKDKKSELDGLNSQQRTQEVTLNSKQETLAEKELAFTEACWKIFKRYQADFKEALKGSMGSKQSFKVKIVQVSQTDQESVNLLSHEVLLAKAETLLGETPETYILIPAIPEMKLSYIEADGIWEKVIVGKSDVDIAALIERLGSNDWVNYGRNFLDGETCPFCQQETINAEFRGKLEGYFDETFTASSERTHQLKAKYEAQSEHLLSFLHHVLQTEKSNSNSKMDLDAFETHLSAFDSQVKSNLLRMLSKTEKVSLKLELSSTQAELTALSELIVKANAETAEHNQLAENFATESKQFIAEAWCFLVEQLKDDISAFDKAVKGLCKAIDGIEKVITERAVTITSLGQEVRDLSKSMTSVQPAVDEINRMLKAYGFSSFEIVPSKDMTNHYSIQRENGDLALHTLSEGEVTFITFLYFVQLAKGALTQEAVTEDRIVVIDDPISSLDSNVLYIVSAIVKQLIGEVKGESSIKQLLLLTHNVYFHKEASFQNGRSNGCKYTHFWILRKANNVTSIQPYKQKNPIESSYELLWREIKERKNGSSVTIQNTMRRILENYFKILGRFSDDDIVAKFEAFEEKQICRSLLYWINDGSHCLPDDLFIQASDDSTELFVGVFKKVFEYSNHIAHYQMMMGEEQVAE